MAGKKRCAWVGSQPIYIDYHDVEWGVPLHDDQKLFEFIVLESAQAGLSWITVLKKRDNYRKAFAEFLPEKVARFNQRSVQRLLQDEGIIRNRQKIEAAIVNARAFLKIQEEFGSFDEYIWRFVAGKPKQNRWKNSREIPAKTRESEEMSKDLIQRGFKFVGPTICYAHMQATGMVNDHELSCFRYKQVQRYA